jgi:glutaconyl-CoA decarboxylase
MKKFQITVNGKAYEVEVEELGGSSAPAPRAAVAAPVAAPAPKVAVAPAAASAPKAAVLLQCLVKSCPLRLVLAKL